jgi:N-acetylglucosamine kinase-like BadF-type ATPase
MAKDLFLGLDGGGTKTAALLVDGTGKVLARHRDRGSAIVGKPSPEACEVIRGTLAALLKQAGARQEDLGHVALSLSGIDFDYEVPMQKEAFSRELGIPLECLALVNDGVAALWGATSVPTALVLMVGTAYVGVSRSRQGQEKLFDQLNVGGLYDIRAEALRMVARMMDGRVAESPLKAKVLQHLGNPTDSEYLEKLYRGDFPWALRMSTAPLLWQSWSEGDPVAKAIIRNAMDDYALAAVTMARGLGSGKIVAAFGGGILAQAPDDFWTELKEKLKQAWPAAEVRKREMSAEAGACVLAAWSAGLDATRFFENLRSQGVAV